MDVKYLVLRVYTCPYCEGEGIMYNPLWVGANETWDQAQSKVLNQGEGQDERQAIYAKSVDAAVAAVRKYWRGLGHNADRPPPEELHCWHCDGTGILRDHADLAEALEAITEGGKHEQETST